MAAWRLVLCDLNGNPLSILSPITTEVSGTWRLNRPASLTFKVPSAHRDVADPHTDGFPKLEEQMRTVKAFREDPNGAYILRFNGYVWDLQDSGDADTATTTVTCFDPFQILDQRDIWQVSTGNWGVYIGDVATHRVREQIDLTNLTFGPTGLTTDGGVFDSTPPNGYQTASREMIGPLIVRLAEAMTGFDVRLDYLDRVDGIMARINCLTRLGSHRSDAIFGWDVPPSNIERITRVKSGSVMANSIHLIGSAVPDPGGGAQPIEQQAGASDAVSIGRYRTRRAVASRSEISDLTLLQALVDTELGFRKYPREVVSLVPVAGRAPEPWIDYGIGDTVPLGVGPRLRNGFTGVVRVYGWEASLGDVEKVTNLIVSPE